MQGTANLLRTFLLLTFAQKALDTRIMGGSIKVLKKVERSGGNGEDDCMA